MRRPTSKDTTAKDIFNAVSIKKFADVVYEKRKHRK
jgi:hypothetical protein